MARWAAMLVAGLALTALVGCNGGEGRPNTGGDPDDRPGAATFTVRWPARSRVVPALAESISIELRRADLLVDRQTADRPAGAGESTVTFSDLAPGAYAYAAAAHPETGGLGTPLAVGTGSLTVTAMHTTTIILDLSSAITRVEVTPSTLALTVGQSRQLTAVARNSAGNAVLVGPTDMLWSTTTAGVATVDASGRVCAVRLGIATIQATEQSSGRYATCAVTVSAAPHDAVLARATTELERVTTNPSLDPVTARAALSSAAADYTEVLNADPTHPQAKFGLAMARAYQGYLDMADMLPVPVKRWVGALDIPGMPSWAGLTPQGGTAAGPAQNRAIASTLPNLSAVLPNFDDVQLAVQNGADIRLRMAVGGSTRTVIFAVNDMQLAAAFGHCVKALLEFGTAYTLDMPGGTLMRATPHDTDGNGLLDAEEYLIPAPFLTCRDTAAMGRAIAALRQASIKAQRGTWLTDHTAGANALVDVADPTTKDGMLKLNKYAAAVSLACSAAVTSGEPFSDHKSRTIDLQKLTTITSLRAVFPSFTAAQPDGGFWPDPTFAGAFRPGVPDDFIPLSYGDLRGAY